MISPLFQQKVYDWPDFVFALFVCERLIFLISQYMCIFFAQRFFEAACSLGIQ